MDFSKVIVVFSVLLASGKPHPQTQQNTFKNVTSNATETGPSPTQVAPQGDRFNEFDWMICKKIVEKAKGNIVISPISLKLVLAMVYEGASGKTADEIADALDLSREEFGRQFSRKKFSKIVENLKSSKGEYDLDLGTSMFIDKSVTPKPTYVRKLQSFYEAQIEQVDFSKTFEAIAAINAWASGITKGHIKNLLSPDDASANTVLMLLNAIYFKGTWLYQFPQNQTKKDIFYADGTTPVEANFMNCACDLYYLDAHEIDSQIVKLPYVGKKFSMYIILPYSRTGLSDLVNKINPFILKEHSKNMYEVVVELSMPTFNIDYTANFGEPLIKLGIESLFSGSAELNEIAETANNSIKVSNILQKAGIQVNEEGSTAYAATEAEIVNKFGDSPNVKLALDHPFLFFIKDEETDSVLFVGNLMNPNDGDTRMSEEVIKHPTVSENMPAAHPTTVPAVSTTSKPESTNCTKDGINPNMAKLVELYFMKEALDKDTKDLIKFYYITGTNSNDLQEMLDLYLIIYETPADLGKLIQFYFSLGFTVEEVNRLVKFYFLMEVTTEDVEKFLSLYLAHGVTDKDIEVLKRFFALKGVTPEVTGSLIKYYTENQQPF